MVDEIQGFADDVNRLREQSKLMESNDKSAQVGAFLPTFYYNNINVLFSVFFPKCTCWLNNGIT